MDDLMRLIALESTAPRHRDRRRFGTVPYGFRNLLAHRGSMHAGDVFEREWVCSPPCALARECGCHDTTHDLPTLRVWRGATSIGAPSWMNPEQRRDIAAGGARGRPRSALAALEHPAACKAIPAAGRARAIVTLRWPMSATPSRLAMAPIEDCWRLSNSRICPHDQTNIPMARACRRRRFRDARQRGPARAVCARAAKLISVVAVEPCAERSNARSQDRRADRQDDRVTTARNTSVSLERRLARS